MGELYIAHMEEPVRVHSKAPCVAASLSPNTDAALKTYQNCWEISKNITTAGERGNLQVMQKMEINHTREIMVIFAYSV